jgi:hypothetical protein
VVRVPLGDVSSGNTESLPGPPTVMFVDQQLKPQFDVPIPLV